VQVARERNRILRELAAGKKQRFLKSFVGRTVEAITLSRESTAENFTEALTDNYLPLLMHTCVEPNLWIHALVTHARDGKLFGQSTHALRPSLELV
jgi:tRNA A37 methylthiotransferase MiaB